MLDAGSIPATYTKSAFALFGECTPDVGVLVSTAYE